MQTKKGYRNPIIPGFNPDPSMVCVGSDFFLATSTFEYFPGVPIYHSQDLVNWEIIGHALNRPSQLDMRSAEGGMGIFAPTLRYHKGRWYMTTSCHHRGSKQVEHEHSPGSRGFYVWTDDIFDETKWSDPIYFDLLGIDQDLLFDDDGEVYMTWATAIPRELNPPDRFHLATFTVRLDLETGNMLSQPVLQRRDDHTGNHVAEGPHMFKRGKWYYLITAEGGTEKDHQEWVQRSATPLGPWEVGPAGVNPIVYNGYDPYIMQTGHMDMVEGPDGRWWAVFLGVRNHDGHLSQLGRETFLAPLEWVDDWPIVNAGKKITLDGDPEGGVPRLPEKEEWSYDFNPSLNLTHEGFYTQRTPQKTFHSLSSHPGALAITGTPYTLAQDETIGMLMKKQTCFTGKWTVDFSFHPAAAREEAGVAPVRGKHDGDGKVGTELVFRKPDDGNGFVETVLPGCPSVSLSVTATPKEYTFAIEHADGTSTHAGTLLATQLVRTRPWDSIFTGTFFGLYAQGRDGFGCTTPAVFTKFAWEGVRGED